MMNNACTAFGSYVLQLLNILSSFALTFREMRYSSHEKFVSYGYFEYTIACFVPGECDAIYKTGVTCDIVSCVGDNCYSCCDSGGRCGFAGPQPLPQHKVSVLMSYASEDGGCAHVACNAR